MNKDEFVGYLLALKEMAEEENFEVDYVLDKVIEKAREMQLYNVNTPYIPWNEPWKPYVTWTANAITDFADDVSAKIPKPNDWSVTKK